MDLLQLMFPLQCTEWLKWNQNVSMETLSKLLGSDGTLYIIQSDKTLSQKTSLLFQCAVSKSSMASPTVLITQNQLQYIPKQIHGMPQPHSVNLKHLKILYMTTAAELMHYIASIHQMSLLPELIVIENLEHYVSESSGDGKMHNMAKLCALLIDAANYISLKISSKCCVLLSVSDQRDGLITTCQRYASGMFKLTHLWSQIVIIADEEAVKKWILTSQTKNSHIKSPAENIIICYTEREDNIKLKDISLVQCRGQQCGHMDQP